MSKTRKVGDGQQVVVQGVKQVTWLGHLSHRGCKHKLEGVEHKSESHLFS